MEKCSSCKVDITNMNGTIKFQCPSCGKATLIRCVHCRRNATKYKCHECNFEGPN